MEDRLLKHESRALCKNFVAENLPPGCLKLNGERLGRGKPLSGSEIKPMLLFARYPVFIAAWNTSGLRQSISEHFAHCCAIPSAVVSRKMQMGAHPNEQGGGCNKLADGFQSAHSID